MRTAPGLWRRFVTASRLPVLAFLMTLLCGGYASAQGYSAGVRGGVNLATVNADSEDGSSAFDHHVRGVFGGFVNIPLFSSIELQPEVLYSMKGAKFVEEAIDAALLLDYLEVPVLGRMSWRVFDNSRFYVAGGPSFGLRVRARTRAEFSGSTEERDISDDVERFDFGAVAAAGFEFGSLVVDGRYTHGFSDVDKDTSDGVKVKNRVVSLTVGLRF